MRSRIKLTPTKLEVGGFYSTAYIYEKKLKNVPLRLQKEYVTVTIFKVVEIYDLYGEDIASCEVYDKMGRYLCYKEIRTKLLSDLVIKRVKPNPNKPKPNPYSWS